MTLVDEAKKSGSQAMLAEPENKEDLKAYGESIQKFKFFANEWCNSAN
jgi:hypothetical protein